MAAWPAWPSVKPLRHMRQELVVRAIIRFAVLAIICFLLIGGLSAAVSVSHKKKKKRIRAAAPAVTVTQVSVRRGRSQRPPYSSRARTTYSGSPAGGNVEGGKPTAWRG